MIELHKRWLESLGWTIDANPASTIEVSWSHARRGLRISALRAHPQSQEALFPIQSAKVFMEVMGYPTIAIDEPLVTFSSITTPPDKVQVFGYQILKVGLVVPVRSLYVFFHPPDNIVWL